MVDARYAKAKTCVWWDIENCRVPRSCDPYSIAQNISTSLAYMNYEGAITISAYGDTTQIGYSVQQALSSTGIALNHVPAGIKDASDKKILVDMLIWGYDNKPPANHLLISGDRDFSNALHQLSMRKYNILLAQPEQASQALVSAAKTVWLWSSLVVGGRPFEKLPSFHNTSTNSRSNIVTESNSILYSSQSHGFNVKDNNNGNYYNGNKAKQIPKTQSQPVISASSSSNGNEDDNKQSIGSSDSSNHNKENDLKHPDHMFASTIAELGSSCITSNADTTPFVPKSKRLVDSGKFNAQCRPTSNYTPKIEQKYGNKVPSNMAMSTADGSGVQESTIKDITKINNDSTFSRPSPLVATESSKPLSIGSTFASIQHLPDMVSGNYENELTQQSHALKAKEGGNISNTASSFSTKSSSQVLPESNCITCNTNPTPCIPKSQQLVDSDKFNAPCGLTSSYKPKFEQKTVHRIPSNIATSTTDGSEVQESTINDTTKINNNSTSSRPSPLAVPESSKPSSIGPTFANIQPLPDMANSNHENKLTQPSHAHEVKDGGNINNTSSSFSSKSSSRVLPESNSPNVPKINASSKVKPVIKGNKVVYKQQQNKYSRSYSQSRNFSGANYNHSFSSSSAPTIRPNNYQSVPSTVPNVSPSTPIPDIGKLNVSNLPYHALSMPGSSIFTGNTMSNNRSGGNLKWQASANCLQAQMGFILEALNILISEKISPTKANISDCFRYGNIGVQNFNVQSALDYAIEHQVVVMHKSEGNCMDLYVGRNDTLWNCVNIMDSDANHDTEKFDAVFKFLSSANGRSAILSSQCRYQAALILRQFCLKEIVLGEILQILHIIIRFRKWIIPHASGWRPLAVTVCLNPSEVSTSSPSTAFGWG